MEEKEKDGFETEYKLISVLNALDIKYDDVRKLNPVEFNATIKQIVANNRVSRSDYENMMDCVTVKLGKFEYDVKLRPYTKTKEWRRQAAIFISKYIDHIKNIKTEDKIDETDKTEEEIANAQSESRFAFIKSAVKSLLPIILSDGIEDLIDLMFMYDSTLPKEEIMSSVESGDIKTQEIVNAAIKVFKLESGFFINLAKELMGAIR